MLNGIYNANQAKKLINSKSPHRNKNDVIGYNPYRKYVMKKDQNLNRSKDASSIKLPHVNSGISQVGRNKLKSNRSYNYNSVNKVGKRG